MSRLTDEQTEARGGWVTSHGLHWAQCPYSLRLSFGGPHSSQFYRRNALAQGPAPGGPPSQVGGGAADVVVPGVQALAPGLLAQKTVRLVNCQTQISSPSEAERLLHQPDEGRG